MTYTIDKLGRDMFESNSTFADSIYAYDDYYLLYNTYYRDTITTSNNVFAVTDVLTGAKKKAAASS